jgi:hypothetical protein
VAEGEIKMMTMQPRELFGVGVRILAVWCWMQAAYDGFWALLRSIGSHGTNPSLSQRDDLSFAIYYALLGIFLIAGARALVWVAYGDAPKDARDAHSMENQIRTLPE